MRLRLGAFTAAAILLSSAAFGQSSGGLAGSIDRAGRLAEQGRLSEARDLVDSLSGVISPDSTGFAQLLFLRAEIAPSILDADLDYRRIATDYPDSPIRESVLLRLAQRALMDTDRDKAVAYLQQRISDYPADSSRARSNYWLARVAFEGNAPAEGCDANSKALQLVSAVEVSLGAQIKDQAARCIQPKTTAGEHPGATALSIAEVPITIPPHAPKNQTMYAVQVAAFDTHDGAEGLAGRLRASGLDARVDGTAKPFRVRIGRFPTYAAAAAELRSLRLKHLDGFVAELSQ